MYFIPQSFSLQPLKVRCSRTKMPSLVTFYLLLSLSVTLYIVQVFNFYCLLNVPHFTLHVFCCLQRTSCRMADRVKPSFRKKVFPAKNLDLVSLSLSFFLSLTPSITLSLSLTNSLYHSLSLFFPHSCLTTPILFLLFMPFVRSPFKRRFIKKCSKFSIFCFFLVL